MQVKNHVLTPPAHVLPESPNHGGAIKPTMIILHYTASGGPDGKDDADYLSRAASRVSAHVVVGRDGTISQIVPFNVQAWHAGKSSWKGKDGCNNYAVGIEIDNWGWLSPDGKSHAGVQVPAQFQFKGTRSGHSLWEAYREPQLAAVEQIIAALVEAYPITDIVGHEDVAPGRKQDPGPALDKFKQEMKDKYLMAEEKETDTKSQPSETKTAGSSSATTTSDLRLRQRPNTGAIVLTTLAKGRKVTVLKKNFEAGWDQVQVGDRMGYVANEYLSYG